MPTPCPQCLSPRTRRRHLGKHVGAALGALVGAAGGAISSTSGLALIAGNVLPIRSSGPRHILAGALAGSAAGAAVGELIDTKILDSHLCLSCGNTFRPSRLERPMWDNR